MRIQRSIRFAVFLLVIAVPARPQSGGGFGSGGGIGGGAAIGPGGGTSGHCDQSSCTMTFTFNTSGGVASIAAVTGAAYSGRQTSESVQTLADGTHITNTSPISNLTYRDSQGRVRTERPMFPAAAAAKSPVNITVVQIQDPVGGYLYVLDSVNRVAHRMQAQIRSMPGLPAGFTPPSNSAGESLGTQVMFGVTLTGVRTTRTTPAGSPMGNDQPITTVSDTWTDPKTNIAVVRKSSSPTGVTTMTLQDYSNADPNPALFQVPAGYQVVDETGSFTIVTQRGN